MSVRYSKSFSSWFTLCKFWVETDLFYIFSSSVRILDNCELLQIPPCPITE